MSYSTWSTDDLIDNLEAIDLTIERFTDSETTIPGVLVDLEADLRTELATRL